MRGEPLWKVNTSLDGPPEQKRPATATLSMAGGVRIQAYVTLGPLAGVYSTTLVQFIRGGSVSMIDNVPLQDALRPLESVVVH